MDKRTARGRLTVVRLMADTDGCGSMDYTKRSGRGRDQRAMYDALGVLVMMFVVVLVVGALGLHVMG